MRVEMGRLVLAFVFAGIAAYCAVSFVTMPYELIQNCTTMAKPDGGGTFFAGVAAGVAAVVLAMWADWS